MDIKRKINIISNQNFKSMKTTTILIEHLNRHGFFASENYSKDAELNITVGGDGAFLRAVHRNDFPNIPFLGINTGHLGFFQEILPDNIEEFVKKYILEEYTVENLFLMDTQIVTKNKKHNIKSVNEMVVKVANSKVIHLDLFIDGNHLEKFSGDGLILSTPSGSTAYSFSAGGSIVYPTLDSLQITPLAPISSKAFRSLPNSIIVPGKSKISIKPDIRHKDSILLINDGMEIKIKDIEYIDMTISEDKIYKLNFNKNMYWDNLKSKFL